MRKFIAKLRSATGLSISGLRDAFRLELAFRYECFALAIGSFIALCLPLTSYDKLLLIASMLPVLCAELLNTAIEQIVDDISKGRIADSYRIAKDCGSAAVFLALLITILVWAAVISSKL